MGEVDDPEFGLSCLFNGKLKEKLLNGEIFYTSKRSKNYD
jgi:hypothetical protein